MPCRRRTLSALALLPAVALFLVRHAEAQPSTLSPEALQKRLQEKPTGEAAARLAEEVRQLFGGSAKLAQGPGPKVDGLTLAWAIEAPGPAAAPKVVWDGDQPSITLQRIGDTDVYAAVHTVKDGFGEAVIYLAVAAKSNAVYMAYKAAKAFILKTAPGRCRCGCAMRRLR